jgi:DNA-binding NtrC family response regulator
MAEIPGSSLNGARILILEDEFFLADDLARALREAGAEPVGPASNMEQAENLVAREHLDAAILDVNIHGALASGFIERLASGKLPCLIVSGYGGDALPEAISGIPRIEKPISPSSVIEILGAELARAG